MRRMLSIPGRRPIVLVIAVVGYGGPGHGSCPAGRRPGDRDGRGVDGLHERGHPDRVPSARPGHRSDLSRPRVARGGGCRLPDLGDDARRSPGAAPHARGRPRSGGRDVFVDGDPRERTAAHQSIPGGPGRGLAGPVGRRPVGPHRRCRLARRVRTWPAHVRRYRASGQPARTGRHPADHRVRRDLRDVPPLSGRAGPGHDRPDPALPPRQHRRACADPLVRRIDQPDGRVVRPRPRDRERSRAQRCLLRGVARFALAFTDRDRHRDPPLPAVRHRPDRQQHARLRPGDHPVVGCLHPRQPGAGVAGKSAGQQRGRGRRGLHAPGGRAVQPAAQTRPGDHRSPVPPRSVRC